MPFCASWNPHADSPHKPDYCKPGRCSKCWSACWHRVDVKGSRCADCTRALVRHPDPAMRMLLVNEPGVGNDVLQALSTDADASVMLAANLLLVDRGLRSSGEVFGGSSGDETGVMDLSHLPAQDPEPVLDWGVVDARKA